MSILIRAFLLSAILLSGCASVEEQVLGMSTANDPEEIADYTEWAIEELQEEEIDYPLEIAKILEAARQMSNRTSLSDLNSQLFNQLVESYVNIANKAPIPDDEDDWIELGLEIEPTRDFLSAYAIHQLGLLKGPALGEQILSIVRSARSEGKRIAALHAMTKHMDSYTINNESRAQALAALSIAQLPAHKSSSKFKEVFQNVEENIVTQDAINTLLKKQKIYRLNDNALDYVLNVNERLWNYYITTQDFPDSGKLKDNVRYMAVLALPRTKQFDGRVPDFTKTQQRAQQMLLAYSPGLYYFNMFENARISDYSYGQLIATLPYMDEMDAFAEKAGDSLVAINNEGRKFFNHRTLLNARVYTAIKGKAIDFVFKHLSKRVDISNPTYRDFMYSQLNEQFPSRFSDHLVKAMKKEYRSAITDEQQAYYASNLVKTKTASAEARPRLLNHLYNLPLNRDLNYSESEYAAVANRIYPYLVDLDSTRFVKAANSRADEAVNVNNPTVFADYYISGLNKQNKTEQPSYHLTLGKLLSRHNEDVSRKVLGYLKTRDVNEGITLFNTHVVTSNKQATEVDFILLGNLVSGQYSKLNQDNVKKVERMTLFGVKNLSEAVALRASQEGLAFFQGFGEAKSIVAATKKRWPELDVKVL